MVRIPDHIVTERFGQQMTDVEIGAGYPNVDAHYVFRRRMKLGLKRRRGGKSGPRKSSRHGSHKLHASASMPAMDNAAFSEKRTIFVSTVVDVAGLNNILVSGEHSRKIGREITKGRAKGKPIYTVTLEERATCPVSCHHWRSCYGNNMHHSKRIRHGDAYEQRLEAELTVLSFKHPQGFAVRLHILGDFYSVEYVNFWRRMLHKFTDMLVFGFTARWEPHDPIAAALLFLVQEKWHRFAVRFSNAPVDECSTVSIEHELQRPPDAIICPAQLGKTESCGSCALCWQSRRRIAFLQH